MRGAKQKNLLAACLTYTNTYVVAVAMDDDGQYPALMFTHNPAFDPAGPRAKEVQKWFNKMSISRDQVIYTKGAKKYSYKSSNMIAHFKNVYCKELSGTRVLHDAEIHSNSMASSFLKMVPTSMLCFPPQPTVSSCRWTTE
jgi:hypothetical protein